MNSVRHTLEENLCSTTSKFGVSDYEASKAFFLKTLEPLGVAVVSEGPTTYGVEISPKGKASLCLYQTGEKPAHVHSAFKAENRQQVEAFHRAALEAGAQDNGAPGLRPQYHPNYYAAFVIGPDGHNIEVVCHDPASTRPMPMKPHITVITLGVDDLERAVAFYRDGLGWPTQGIVGTEFEHGAVAFFNLQPGLKLALWPRRSIAHDSGLPAAARAPGGMTLAHNVGSVAEVEAVMAQAQAAGAVLVKPAQPTFYGGHAGYFQDPEGHVWEVAFNPGLADLG